MNAIETVARNLLRDRERASLLSSRLLNYADELATALLGYGTLESTDEELELSFRDMKELMDTERAESAFSIVATLTEAETALLDAEVVRAITHRAKIATYLPTLESLDGKWAYFRNA